MIAKKGVAVKKMKVFNKKSKRIKNKKLKNKVNDILDFIFNY